MIEYPAITLWEPWASLVAHGCKPFEFRHWPAPSRVIGRRIAIHAGARPVKKDEVRSLLLHLHSLNWRSTGLKREESIKLLEPVLMSPAILPRSSIVCTAVMGEPIRNEALMEAMGVSAAEIAATIGALINDSDRSEHTNWGWPMLDVQPLLPPVPARGAQGFWKWRTEG